MAICVDPTCKHRMKGPHVEQEGCPPAGATTPSITTPVSSEPMGTGTPTMGRQVVVHTPTGDHVAIVTRVNPNATLCLTVLAPGDIFYRNDVQEYVPEPDDEDEDKFGKWSWPTRA